GWLRPSAGEFAPMRSHFARLLAAVAFSAGLVAAIVATGGSRPPLARAADDKKAAEAPKFTPQQVAFYEKEVLPLLQQHCLKCHGAEDKIKGELNLATRKGVLDGGESGAVVDLKNPANS